jgi:Protein of unknown function (DUF3987)
MKWWTLRQLSFCCSVAVLPNSSAVAACQGQISGPGGNDSKYYYSSTCFKLAADRTIIRNEICSVSSSTIVFSWTKLNWVSGSSGVQFGDCLVKKGYYSDAIRIGGSKISTNVSPGEVTDMHEFTATLTAPAVFSFSDEAQELFRKWITELQTSARSGKHPPALESHMLKMPKTIASLALLFELVNGGRGTVGAVAAARAFDWADYLLTHATRLYTSGSVLAENGARLILARRKHLPAPFTGRDVHRKAWAGIADRDAVAAAIETLCSAGYIREIASSPSESGGRPSVGYVWNPHIKDEEK